MSAKKESLDIESSRSTHRGASLVSSFNSHVIKKVFGTAEDHQPAIYDEQNWTKVPSLPSKTTVTHPLQVLSLDTSLKERIEGINEKRHAEAFSKLSSFQQNLAEL